MARMLCENLGIRAVSRLTGLHQQTILNVLETVGAKCEEFLREKVRNVPAEEIAVDELYSYVGRHPSFTDANDPERGEFYCYLSIGKRSKLIFNHLVEKRNGENCRAFMADLKSRVVGRIELSTDGFSGYTAPLGSVFQVFRNEIDYGSEIKTYANAIPIKSSNRRVSRKFNPIVCTSVKRVARIGNPEISRINTSHAERLNLTVRLFSKRFARATMGYSKKRRNHELAVAMFVWHYNFARVHSAHKQTPAQAAGLAMAPMTFEDLLAISNL